MEELEIEVGKQYITRDLCLAVVERFSSQHDACYPYQGKVLRGGTWESTSWTVTGKFIATVNNRSDLISEN